MSEQVTEVEPLKRQQVQGFSVWGGRENGGGERLESVSPTTEKHSLIETQIQLCLFC